MILRRILQRLETGMTLDRCATVALTILFYEVLWLVYALIRLAVLPDSTPLLGYDFSAF